MSCVNADSNPHGPSLRLPALALAGWLALSFWSASLGAICKPRQCYASLQKAWWNPPGWIFGPVWTAPDAMMAVAGWEVWRHGGFPGALAFALWQLRL